MPWKDPARRSRYHAEYRIKNAERVVAAVREWRESHPDIAEYNRTMNRRNYAKKADAIKARNNARRAARVLENPKLKLLECDRAHRRRGRIVGRVTMAQWEHVLRLYGAACLVCGSPKITRDHVIPVSKGGAHAANNLQPLCDGCNKKKAAKIIDYRPFPYVRAA